MARRHTRIIQHLFAPTLQGALLGNVQQEWRRGQSYLRLQIQAFEKTSPSELFTHSGGIYERLHGEYVPIELKFSGISELKTSDFLRIMKNLPQHHPSRMINDMLCWRQPERQDLFFLFFMQASDMDSLTFFARRVDYERFDEGPGLVLLERDWSPAPLMPGRLVPQPKRLHARFGGDPITIRVNGKVRHHKLLIGGLDIQPAERPQVDAVLNLGEEPSRWETAAPGDRLINKGEGAHGMTVAEICEEAEWVIDRLEQDQRVLVHCVAGMNRSATVCCAVLMMLEKLSAETALQRVREHHPWARPDSHHWLALRWLERTQKGEMDGL
jgi:hypothetical protein